MLSWSLNGWASLIFPWLGVGALTKAHLPKPESHTPLGKMVSRSGRTVTGQGPGPQTGAPARDLPPLRLLSSWNPSEHGSSQPLLPHGSWDVAVT